MEAVKKYCIWGIFISILAIIAMSHNASAVESVFDISDYDLIENFETQPLNCSYNDDHTTIGYGYCSLGGTYYQLNSITFNPRTYRTGDLVEFDIVSYGNSQSFTNGETVSGSLTNPFDFPFINTSIDYSVLSITPVQFENTNQILNLYQEIICRPFGASSTDCISYPELTIGYKYFQAWRVVIKIKRDLLSYPLTLSGTSSLSIFDLTGYNLPNDFIKIRVSRFNKWRLTETQENKEVEQKTQDAVDDSQAAGGDSSTDAQSGTTGLINAITGAVSVISSAQPTNCKINGNMGNLDIGQLDLCANPAPAFVQTIGSLILILMCIPLAISLFNRFIAIFRSFQS